jgi:hypothetical protein
MNSGRQWYEVKGEIVTSKLEENVLLLLKNATGGRYVRLVEVNDFSMTSMISRMEVKHIPGQYEFFPWLLLASVFAFLAAVVIGNEPDGKPKANAGKNRDQRPERREPR